ncbi:unnamed protein product [Amoebophrya sp. A120]|nr:unnamed protein product [Amoebophrya sp. A120]|eukprot:GSA120T00010534001.1
MNVCTEFQGAAGCPSNPLWMTRPLNSGLVEARNGTISAAPAPDLSSDNTL